MDVTFYEKGRNKIAAYILTYEEGQDPNIMEKIDADLAERGKKGYTVGIVTLLYRTTLLAWRNSI